MLGFMFGNVDEDADDYLNAVCRGTSPVAIALKMVHFQLIVASLLWVELVVAYRMGCFVHICVNIEMI